MIIDYILNQRKKNLDRFGNAINSAITSNMNIGATNLDNYFSAGLKAVTKNPQKNTGKWVYNAGAVYNPKTKGITVTEQTYNKIKEKEKEKMKLNFGKKATKANNTKSNNIAGYINGIPVKEASAYAKAWDKRRVNEEHILGLMQDLLGMTGWLPNQTQNTNNIDIPLPTMPNRSYDNSFGGRLAKAIDMKTYANQLKAYTELNKAKILASSKSNISNRVTNFLNLYKTLIPETESLNPNSAYSSKSGITTKDKISLLSALTKGLVNPATNTLDTNAYMSVLGSLFPNLAKNIKLQPSTTNTATTKEQDKEREKQLKAILQALGR